MKLVSHIYKRDYKAALLIEDKLYTISDLMGSRYSTMQQVLTKWSSLQPRLARLEKELIAGKSGDLYHTRLDIAVLGAPLPEPSSLRDGYAFRRHVETMRRNRGLSMIPQFDEYPVFYFGNNRNIYGPGPIEVMADHCEKLDFELEVAIVISKGGKNIKAADADQHIAGLMIMNDLSARQLQMEEMLLNLGPAKGKDFATTLGPWLVTPDEIAPCRIPAKEGHTGNSYNLRMTASVNGILVSEGNLADMEWTFAELIERASYGVELHPGDVIGSGTVGTGCFLEINGTRKAEDSSYQPQWLQPGDEVVLEVEGLGKLVNTITPAEEDHSILALKKVLISQTAN